MANPSVIDNRPATVAAATSAASVVLNLNRGYTIAHNGLDATGAADVNPIFFAFDATATASYASGTNKVILVPGRSLRVDAEVNYISFIVAAGAPTFTVVADDGE